MTPILRDMVDHQFWADRELWSAIGAHGPARDDKAIRDRLHHVHQVQRLFIWAVGDRARQPAITTPEGFPSFDDLHGYARDAHDDVRRTILSMTDTRLSEAVVIPWVPDPPLSITVAEALLQMTMHSHYHRGQNAARLRELGGDPPITDFIFWLWKGKPADGQVSR
jgi:uncharacterized damage-inducible protein DinB